MSMAGKYRVLDVAQRILAQHGRIDVMVASAGINVKQRNWHNLSEEDWDSVIRINLDGAFYCCKAVLPAMNESINMEAVLYGVRVCAVCPGEVATPILDNRPIPVSREDHARMVQAEDCGELIKFLAQLPRHVCINDLTISPTWNRSYAAAAKTQLPKD